MNKIASEPSLKDLLDLHKKDVMLSMSCHAIATIRSFDKETQRATATVNYKKTFYQQNSKGLYNRVLVDYPLLVDCPVIVLGGGGCSLTFPILPGNECVVLFNDRDIDNWFRGGASEAPATERLHSFSDGIIIVGIRSLENVIDDYDDTRGTLRNGDTVVAVGESLVKIANSVTTLNTLLQSLVSTIKGLSTIPCVSGSPVTLSPATIAALTSVATQIEGLLE